MTPSNLKAIQACIRNHLDEPAVDRKLLAGIVGDAPSHYSKSPSLWNRVFRDLGLEAVYLPFDVNEARLPEFVHALKDCARLMGVNVTVPYKIKIMDHLDDIDDQARRIKAVNTIVRTRDGRLLGYNTDGQGFVDSLTMPQPGGKGPFVESLAEMDVLVIGAGGSARAVTFHVAEAIAKGRLFICNRTAESANSLAEEVNRAFGNASAITEDGIASIAPQMGLIANCTTKGQGGIRHLANGRVTILEPYSALAPANPATFSAAESRNPGFHRTWLSASLSDIEANNRASLNLALAIPLGTRFCDLIYFPAETVFLRHGRLSGHRTLNGKGMIVAQAVEAFCRRICRDHLESLGLNNPQTRRQIAEIMYAAWDAPLL